MMDTERMLPSQMNGGSPGSNQSGGQLSNGPGGGGGLFNGHHHYQNASPTTPIGHPHPGKICSKPYFNMFGQDFANDKAHLRFGICNENNFFSISNIFV